MSMVLLKLKDQVVFIVIAIFYIIALYIEKEH
jgi:hypothetical protein